MNGRPFSLSTILIRGIRDLVIIAVAVLLTASIVIAVRVAFPTRTEGDRTPDLVKLTYDDFNVESSDGIAIDGWFIPSTAGGVRPTVLVLHPYGTGKWDVLDWTYQLAESYNLAYIDFRGNGASGGRTSFGKNETRDVAAAVEYIRTRPEADPDSMALVGYGMGAMVALRSTDLPGVVGVLADTPVMTISSVIRKDPVYDSWWMQPVDWLADGLLRYGFGENQESSHVADAVRDTDIPIELWHVTGDPDADVAVTDALADSAEENGTYWRIDGQAHFVLYGAKRDESVARMLAFFQKIFQ